MIQTTPFGTSDAAIRRGTMKLVFAYPNGEELGEPALVDATPQGTDRTVFAMFGVLAGLRLRDEPHQVNFGTKAYETGVVNHMWSIYRLLQRAQTFARDPDGEERITIRGFADIAELRKDTMKFVGDCDDVAFFAAACLTAVGLDPVFCVVGPEATSRDPLRFRHILWGVKLPWGGDAPTRENVILADSQESGYVGFWPLVGDMGVARIYCATGKDSVFYGIAENASA